MATVFIVGDASRHGAGFSRALRRAGYHTLPLSDAATAVDVLCSIKADVLVVSLDRDATDGASLIDILRHDTRWREMPLIVTGARLAGDYYGLRERLGVGEILLDSESSPEEVLEQVRKFTEPVEPLAAADDSLESAS